MVKLNILEPEHKLRDKSEFTLLGQQLESLKQMLIADLVENYHQLLYDLEKIMVV